MVNLIIYFVLNKKVKNYLKYNSMCYYYTFNKSAHDNNLKYLFAYQFYYIVNILINCWNG